MYWLASCREPMQIIDLEGLLHPDWHCPQPWDYQPHCSVEQPPPRSSLLTVLQSLRRRNIIFESAQTEQDRRCWSLRPMVMEYVAGRFVERISIEIEQQTPFLLNTHPITQANTTDYARPAQLRVILSPRSTSSALVLAMSSKSILIYSNRPNPVRISPPTPNSGGNPH